MESESLTSSKNETAFPVSKLTGTQARYLFPYFDGWILLRTETGLAQSLMWLPAGWSVFDSLQRHESFSRSERPDGF
jgi:hypothetical protein